MFLLFKMSSVSFRKILHFEIAFGISTYFFFMQENLLGRAQSETNTIKTKNSVHLLNNNLFPDQ